MADELTQAGMSVLVLERGRNRLINLENPHELAGDYSSDELKFLARHFLGPIPGSNPGRSVGTKLTATGPTSVR